MSERGIFGLKPDLRLEWRGQGGQYETQKPDHSASLGDSVTPSTRIGFSAHTGCETSANRGSAMDLGAVEAPTIQRSELCRRPKPSASRSAKSSEHLRPPNASTVSETQAMPNPNSILL